MKFKLVRLIDNKEPVCVIYFEKMLTGSNIYALIDEYTDPLICETKNITITNIRNVGLSLGWPGECKLMEDCDDDYDFDFEDLNFGDEMFYEMSAGFRSKKGWVKYKNKNKSPQEY